MLAQSVTRANRMHASQASEDGRQSRAEQVAERGNPQIAKAEGASDSRLFCMPDHMPQPPRQE